MTFDMENSDYYAITPKKVLTIREDLQTNHIRPNMYCEAERRMISRERRMLIERVEQLKLEKRGLLLHLKSIKSDIVSMPELWLLKRQTEEECSATDLERIENLTKALSEILHENHKLKIEILSLNQAIEKEISSRNLEIISDIDLSNFRLHIPELEEIEQQRAITAQLNEWNLDRIYASQLELSKFDLLRESDEPRVYSAATSLADVVNASVKKGVMSSDEKRILVQSMMEKLGKKDDKLHKLESVVRSLRQQKIYSENERDKTVMEMKAKNKAHLQSMKEEILKLNNKRSILRKQNRRHKRQYVAMCEELEQLDKKLSEVKKSREGNPKLEQEEEEKDEDTLIVECDEIEEILIKQKYALHKEIQIVKRQLRKEKRLTKHRMRLLKREIAQMWQKEIMLRHDAKWFLDELSNPFPLTSSIALT